MIGKLIRGKYNIRDGQIGLVVEERPDFYYVVLYFQPPWYAANPSEQTLSFYIDNFEALEDIK